MPRRNGPGDIRERRFMRFVPALGSQTMEANKASPHSTGLGDVKWSEVPVRNAWGVAISVRLLIRAGSGRMYEMAWILECSLDGAQKLASERDPFLAERQRVTRLSDEAAKRENESKSAEHHNDACDQNPCW
jgi:hypothetical protein